MRGLLDAHTPVHHIQDPMNNKGSLTNVCGERGSASHKPAFFDKGGYWPSGKGFFLFGCLLYRPVEALSEEYSLGVKCSCQRIISVQVR